MGKLNQVAIPLNLSGAYKQYQKIEKVADNKFAGNHPSGINEGYVKYLISHAPLNVGEPFCGYDDERYIQTSPVTELVSDTEHETVFKTHNSTYKLTKWPF